MFSPTQKGISQYMYRIRAKHTMHTLLTGCWGYNAYTTHQVLGVQCIHNSPGVGGTSICELGGYAWGEIHLFVMYNFFTLAASVFTFSN